MDKTINFNELLVFPDKPYEKFHSKTKLKKFNKSVSKEEWPRSWTETYVKSYVRLKQISLPEPKRKKLSFYKTLEERRSTRNFNQRKTITLNSLSTLLYYSAGLKQPTSRQSNLTRFYPSAGARYPLETYVISLNTELPKGLYHYYLRAHCLEEMRLFNSFNFRKFFNRTWIKKAACLIIITAVFKRTTIKYGDRGYRNVLIEAGHMGQNIYLNCSALDIGCCAVAGFIDDKINRLIDCDGLNESVVYVFALGSKPKL